jgi:hypothetical protein
MNVPGEVASKHGASPGTERPPVHAQGHNELQHPSHALLEEQGFDKVTYSTYRERCLADRADLGAHPACSTAGTWR